MRILDMNVETKQIEAHYNSEGRFYHNWNHIISMINNIEKYFSFLNNEEKSLLTIAIIFHDYIYDIHKNDNEEKSCEEFLKSDFIKLLNNEEIQIIQDLIMATKTLNPKTNLEEVFIFLDWTTFLGNEKELYLYNFNIFKEYQEFNYLEFCEGREKFFKFAPDKFQNAFKIKEYIERDLIEKIYEGIKTSHKIFLAYKPRIGIYAGSFNPFHIGHLDILHKAEKFFDKIILVQAVNIDKNNDKFEFPKLKRETYISKDNKFIGEIFKELESNYEASLTLIRGIRTGHDLIAEQSYHKTICDLGFNYGIIHILSEPEHQHISSTMIRGAIQVSKEAEKWIVK